MSFDNSRFPFNPSNDFCGVVMQQGRVQLDADWNEWLAELSRRTQAGTLDILGRAVYPATTPFAFQISASSSGTGNTLTIGPGRMYVDGLLAENHGDPNSAQWDPALAEMSGSPQPPSTSLTGAIDYTQQPYMPAGSVLPSGKGPFLAYLDVWIRPVTYLEYPDLVDKAVGVDSTARLQTAWQVQLLDLGTIAPGATCDSNIPGWPPAPLAGLLTTDTAPVPPSGPCCLTSGAAYTGMENQFYRVEIHQPGAAIAAGTTPSAPLAAGTATFKWSRDDASVMTAVTHIANAQNSEGNPASQLSVLSLGRDQVLGFAPGNWIEILDDSLEFAGQPGQPPGQPGELRQIDSVDYAAKTITLAKPLGAHFANPQVHTRIQRWDQSGNVYLQDGKTVWWDVDTQGGDIPVPPAGTALLLENGIIVNFDLDASITGGTFHTRDFWTFAARTADGSVETLNRAHPRGIHHHYAKLSIVTFLPSSAPDCRTEWPPATGTASSCGCCCTVTVGDGGKFTSIQQAINSLPANGGEVCILPGRYFENIVIRGKDIVLRGCGWQTRIASASLKPQPPPVAALARNAPVAAATSPASGKFPAVITVTAAQHVQLLSFAVEAAKDEVGVLLDGSGALSAPPQSNTRTVGVVREPTTQEFRGVRDVTLSELVLTASTLPAVLANQVLLLQVEGNRVAMQDVRTQWPAVWVSGAEMRILRNWVGIQNTSTQLEWLPTTVYADLSTDAVSGGTNTTVPVPGKLPMHPGGIQIAGLSRDVFVLENEIEEGSGNGITLGSVSVLDSKGTDTGTIVGVLPVPEDPCATGGTLQIPTNVPGTPGNRFVAGSALFNILIDRNRIRGMGLCGIGPVGFFDLRQALEVISIENLTISSNAITQTLRRNLLEKPQQDLTTFGCGAICVPDVVNLIVRDNSIIDFGSLPGANVCGIFLLHAQMADISGNQVLETRDWVRASQMPPASAGGARGGIVVFMVTPPSFPAPLELSQWTGRANLSGAYSAPVYEPSLPALRVHHNVVRVPLGETLAAVGLGPFSIRGNEFSCGGTVTFAGRPIATTVLILNLGAAIELAATRFAKLQSTQGSAYTTVGGRVSNNACSGAVVFTSNICQLEARASEQRAVSSVAIFSFDDVIVGDNQCWVDGPTGTLFFDALLAAGTLQVTSNRLQEGPLYPVFASGLTLGVINIVAQNISTYCLFNFGVKKLLEPNNIAIIAEYHDKACPGAAREMRL